MSDFAKSIGAIPVDDTDDFAKSIGAQLVPDEVSKAEIVARGTVQGAFPFADETTGAAEAAYKGVFGDDKLADFVSNYKKYRNESRKEYDAAEKANPGLYLGSQIAGGIGSAFLPVYGALNAAKGAKLLSVMGKGALQGGLTGLGNSESETIGGDIKNTAMGAGIGLAAGPVAQGVAKVAEPLARGITKVAGKVARAVGDDIKTVFGSNKMIGGDATKILKAITSGATQGAKEGGKDLPAGIDWVGSSVGAVKGAIQEAKSTASGMREYKKLLGDAQRMFAESGDDGVKALAGASDDDIVAAALMADGNNPVKAFYAQKSATIPGQINSDDYLTAMSLPSDTRQAARAFNPREAAKELVPEIDALEDLFIKSRATRFNELQDIAREQFDPKGVGAVLKNLHASWVDAGKLKSIPKSVAVVIEDANTMISYGRGTTQQNLQEGLISRASDAEKFNRLQQARQLLDSKINWAAANGEDQAGNLLKSVRSSIDDALKISPEKVEGDALWAASKKVEEKFFDVAKFGKRGSREIDETKIAKMFGKTDAGVRTSKTLDELKAYANNEKMLPAMRDEWLKVIKSFEDKITIMDQKRGLDTLRYKQGPSSPAIERLHSIANKNGILDDAINTPAGSLNSIDEFRKFIKVKTGVSFEDLSTKEKVGAASFAKWMRANPAASEEASDQMFNKLVRPVEAVKSAKGF